MLYGPPGGVGGEAGEEGGLRLRLLQEVQEVRYMFTAVGSAGGTFVMQPGVVADKAQGVHPVARMLPKIHSQENHPPIPLLNIQLLDTVWQLEIDRPQIRA